jgi:hypothetical protein
MLLEGNQVGAAYAGFIVTCTQQPNTIWFRPVLKTSCPMTPLQGQLLLEAEQMPLRLIAPPQPPLLPAPPSAGSQQQGEGQGEGGEAPAAAPAGGGETEEDPEEAARARALLELQRTGGCEHVAAGAALPLAHGLCRTCYEEYVKVSGGVVQVGGLLGWVGGGQTGGRSLMQLCMRYTHLLVDFISQWRWQQILSSPHVSLAHVVSLALVGCSRPPCLPGWPHQGPAQGGPGAGTCGAAPTCGCGTREDCTPPCTCRSVYQPPEVNVCRP